MTFPQFKPGDRARLEENDCFGGTRYVTIIKVHKGGNVTVRDGYDVIEVSVHNLTPARACAKESK